MTTSAHKEGSHNDPSSLSQLGVTRDRRAHRRWVFRADIEIESDPGGLFKGQVANLGLGGCYVETENSLPIAAPVKVWIGRNGDTLEAEAKVVYVSPHKGVGLMFSTMTPPNLELLTAWISPYLEKSWLVGNRLARQHVTLQLPVRVSAYDSSRTKFIEDTHTAQISALGGSMRLSKMMRKGQRLTLSNLRTRATVECAVVHVADFKGQPCQPHLVGFAFLAADQYFWSVRFPPTDWSPRHPDAKNLLGGSPTRP